MQAGADEHCFRSALSSVAFFYRCSSRVLDASIGKEPIVEAPEYISAYLIDTLFNFHILIHRQLSLNMKNYGSAYV